MRVCVYNPFGLLNWDSFLYHRDYWVHSASVYGKAFGSECFEDYIGESVSITFLSCFEMEEEAEDPEVRMKRAWEKMGVCFLGWFKLSKSEFLILLITIFSIFIYV